MTVLNVNDWDPQFLQDRYEFVVNQAPSSGNQVRIGQVRVIDADGDHVDLKLKGNDARYFPIKLEIPTARWRIIQMKFTVYRAFSIDEEGEILLADVSLLNGTTHEFVVVGRDGGIPPRQTSVAVIVHVPADMLVLVGGSTWWSASESSPILLIVLGILLGVMCLVISGLAIYVCQT